jgi:hypothetical protein
VSVFLSVILTPCIVASGMFVDLSRVRLAGALTASAGDLALDSLLTRYDFELSEFYGLLASCQNIDEFYAAAETGFRGLIKSQGLSEEETDTLLAQIRALTGAGAGAADLLRIDAQAGEGGMFTPVPEANMANPALIKSGIVSFMKYRAPASLLLGDSILQKLRETGGEMGDSEKNQEITETRHTYYEAESALRDKAYGIYEKLRDCQALYGGDPAAALAAMSSELDAYREDFGKIHAAIAAQLFAAPDAGTDAELLDDGRSVYEAISDIQSGMARHRANAERAKALLDAASEELGALGGFIGPYKDSFVSWDDSASSAGTSMAGTHLDEIADIRGNTDIDAIDEASISELKARVDGLSAFYGQIIERIDGVQYGNRRVLDIFSYDDALWASGLMSKSLGEGETLDAFAVRTFNFTPRTGPVMNVNAASARPSLDSAPRPALYTWMAAEFGGVDRNAKRKGDAKMKEYLEMGKTETEASKQGGDSGAGEITSLTASEFPSGFDGKGMSVMSGLGAVASLAGELFKDFSGALENMRDDLYTVEYVTGMFSHYTYEKEARYGLLSEEDRGNITWRNSETYYARVTGDAKTAGTWLSEEARDVYNKSLTCRLVNKTNNYACGAELEYILYGGKNSDNIGKAIGSIFALRYLLNTPYAFAAFWGLDNNTGRAINAAAAAISAWSGGIIPVPLIKSVLILALVALETANDVEMLKAGLPVKLLKLYTGGEGDPDWAVQFGGDGDGGVTPSTREGAARDRAIRLTYGDYMYVFLLIGYYGGGELAADMYRRTADLIQANVRLAAGGDVSARYSLEKSVVYIGMSATVRAAPLMLALPIASGYENDLTDTSDWYTIKYRAVRGYGG